MYRGHPDPERDFYFHISDTAQAWSVLQWAGTQNVECGVRSAELRSFVLEL